MFKLSTIATHTPVAPDATTRPYQQISITSSYPSMEQLEEIRITNH